MVTNVKQIAPLINAEYPGIRSDWLDKLREIIATINVNIDNVNDLQSQATDISNSNQELIQEIATLKQNIETLEKTVTENNQAITTIQGDIASVKSDVTTLHNDVAANQSAIAALQTTVADHTASIDSINAKIDSINTNITTINNSIDTINMSVQAHENRLDMLETQVADHTTAINALNTTVSDHTSKISSLESDVDDIKDDIITLTTTATKLESDLQALDTSLKNDIALLNSSITSINNSISSLQSQITLLINDYTALEKRMKTIEDNGIVNFEGGTSGQVWTAGDSTTGKPATGYWDGIPKDPDVSANTTAIADLQNHYTTLQSSVDTATNEISSLDSRVTATENDIAVKVNKDDFSNGNIGQVWEADGIVDSVGHWSNGLITANNIISNHSASLAQVSTDIGNINTVLDGLRNDVNNLMSTFNGGVAGQFWASTVTNPNGQWVGNSFTTTYGITGPEGIIGAIVIIEATISTLDNSHSIDIILFGRANTTLNLTIPIIHDFNITFLETRTFYNMAVHQWEVTVEKQRPLFGNEAYYVTSVKYEHVNTTVD